MDTNKHIIYQTFPRLFGNFTENPVRNGSIEVNGCGKFNTYSNKALESIKALGVTHIWFTGVLAHATSTDYTIYGIPKDHPAIVKGKAGSPYAIKDYYDVDPDLAAHVPDRMNEFQALIDRTHEAGMKVIIDFVPNHVSRTYQSLMKPADADDFGQCDQKDLAFSPANNFYYLPGQKLELQFGPQEINYIEFPAKATGNDCFTASPSAFDWYETVKLNFGIDYFNGHIPYFEPVPDTWKKMLHILLYWVEKGVDGFRCDMAEMVPVQFWRWVIPQVKNCKDTLFIAEVYNPSFYREYLSIGHFDYLYDKVETYDALRNIICDGAPVNHLKTLLHKNEDIHERMLFFLENHDERRIASDFFAGSAKAGIPAFIFLATYRANPLLIYNGQEFGEKGMDNEGFSGHDGKTTIFDYWRMDSIRRWANNGLFDGGLLNSEQSELRASYQQIVRLAVDEKAFSMGNYFSLSIYRRNNPPIPADRMLAYLRKYENELILVCINFDDIASDFCITIPEHAFNVMQIPDNAATRMKNLFTGEESICALTCTCPFQGTINAHTALIFKFLY